MISSYDLVDMAIAGAEEQHPEWKLNQDMVDQIVVGCHEIDVDFKTGKFILHTEVTESGDVVIFLRDGAMGDNMKVWILEEVFLIE